WQRSTRPRVSTPPILTATGRAGSSALGARAHQAAAAPEAGGRGYTEDAVSNKSSGARPPRHFQTYMQKSEKRFQIRRALLLLLEQTVHGAEEARLRRTGNRLAGGGGGEQAAGGRATGAGLAGLFGAFGGLGLALFRRPAGE